MTKSSTHFSHPTFAEKALGITYREPKLTASPRTDAVNLMAAYTIFFGVVGGILLDVPQQRQNYANARAALTTAAQETLQRHAPLEGLNGTSADFSTSMFKWKIPDSEIIRVERNQKTGNIKIVGASGLAGRNSITLTPADVAAKSNTPKL